MRAALYLSAKHTKLTDNEAKEILRTLKALGLPLELPAHIDIETALAKTATDKKFCGGNIRFILLNSLGHPVLSNNVTAQDLKDALLHLTTPVQEL
jgi:3-dehydroquinate synthase